MSRECRHDSFRKAIAGFTLVELAIVLVIVALLTGGLLVSVGAQQESSARAVTEQRLNSVVDAVIGYTAANGRLPCPAAPAATGAEAPAGGGVCSNPWDGFVPARTLGLGPTDANGYLLDAWGNPIRYAITKANGDSFTTANGMKSNWAGGLGPNLRVCNTGVGIAGNDCAAGTTLTDTAVAVVFSRGKNGGGAPSSVDEAANGDADPVFVSHTPVSTGNEFDDIVVWLSPNILYNRLIAAGRLP